MATFEKEFNNAAESMGHVNILIAGKTGVGKSTLINAVFQDDFAETGEGRPVTQHSKEYTKEGFPVSIIDTKGFELEDYNVILKELQDEIGKRKTGEPSTHIHIAWYCVNNYSRRFEEAEAKFVQALSEEVPVIVVLTQSEHKYQDFYRKIVDDAPSAKEFIHVLAKDVEDEGVIVKKAYGVDNLVDTTIDLIPEALRAAFASAQKISFNQKTKAARKAITFACTGAAAVCASPIPFSDAALLAPVQITMLASISKIMGLDLSKAALSTLVASGAGVAAATYAGRTIVTGLLKLILGAGTLIGASVGAATATVLTKAMGEAYLAALSGILKNNSNPSADEIGEAFKEALRNKKNNQ